MTTQKQVINQNFVGPYHTYINLCNWSEMSKVILELTKLTDMVRVVIFKDNHLAEEERFGCFTRTVS